MIRALFLLAALTISVDGPADSAPEWEARVTTLAGQVERAMGFTYDGAIRVELAPTDADFRRRAPRAPAWAAAIARPRAATLVVRLPATGPATGTDVTSVLRHELVHLMLPQRLGGHERVPLWFEEGLCQVLGARILPVSTARLKMAAAAGRLFPFSALSRQFPDGRAPASLAYAQSESVVERLVATGGIERLRVLLDRIEETGSFEGALADVYGVTTGELEAAWRTWLLEKGRPWWLEAILSNLVAVLLFTASILVILAWLRARRRGRETYESLPE
ncbi:MAG: hypothetical protein ABFS86_01490 [Planctomycetota bacterium]